MLLTGLKLEARAAARRAGFTACGVVFLIVGIAFLSGACWMLVAEARDPLFATIVLGAVYSGLGLIFLGLASRRHVRVRVPPPSAAAAPPRMYTYTLPALIEAFMVGIHAGMANRAGGGRER